MWDHEKVLSDFEQRVVQSHEKMIARSTFIHEVKNADEIASTFQKLAEVGPISNGKKRNSTYVSHGIHEYKGKFYPQIAKSLLNYLANGRDNVRIMDPFSGSGTVLTEASLMGFDSYGIELSPVAVMISKAKIALLRVDSSEFGTWSSNFLTFLEEERESSWEDWFDLVIHDELQKWFPVPVLNKLSAILSYSSELDGWRNGISKVLISNIIRNVSQQDPRDLRINYRSEKIDDADVYRLLKNKVTKLTAEMENYFHARLVLENDIGKVVAVEADNRKPKNWPEDVDIFLTSPPYGSALPYIDTYRLSNLVFFGTRDAVCRQIEKSLTGARDIRKTERKRLESQYRENPEQIFSLYARNAIDEMFKIHSPPENKDRRKNKAAITIRYFLDMQNVFSSMSQHSSDNSCAAFVIGNTTTTSAAKDFLVIPNIEFTVEAMEHFGWVLSDRFGIDVTTEDKAHSKNAIRKNDILIFRKSTTEYIS